MATILVAAAVAAAACNAPLFQCQGEGDCGGADAQCIDGACAFPDETCPSGLRFSMHSGTLTGQCVELSSTESAEPTDGIGETESTSGTSTGVPSTTEQDTGTGESSSSATTNPVDPTGGTTGTSTSTDPSDASETVAETETDTAEPPRGSVEFLDDELGGEFGEGTFVGTSFSGGRLRLADGFESGVFLSRVFDAQASVNWAQLSWSPDAPYAKPLPANGGAEVGYDEGNVDMSLNQLLLRFDEEGALPDGTVLADASGNDIVASIVSAGEGAESAEGVFDAAIADSLDARVSLGEAAAMNLGESPFTMSVWFQVDHDCAQDTPLIAIDDVPGASDGAPLLWFGCSQAPNGLCAGAEGPRLAGRVTSSDGAPGDGAMFCGNETFDAGWHHGVLVKSGHADTEIQVFLDGQLSVSVNGTLSAPLDFPGAGDFSIGGQSGGAVPSQSLLDEVAIWTRALSVDEIDALYARGAQRVELEVRICQLEDCADAPPFAGPKSGGRYADPVSAASPGAALELPTESYGRYAQYRVHLERTPLAPTPTLSSVSIAGDYE